MYIPGHFAVNDRAQQLQFIRKHGFATLVSHDANGLFATHLPFLLNENADGSISLIGHVARANPHWKAIASGAEVMTIFSGPHAYISPRWYEMHPSVPTWNYTVLHAYGKGTLLDDKATQALLKTLADQYESGSKTPWRMEGLTSDYVEKMVSAIVGFEIAVERIECKFKLSQNRSAADRKGVIAALRQSSLADQDVAAFMEWVEKSG